MVKVASREMGVDDACNLGVGAVAVVNGLISIFKPEKVHDKAVKMGSSKSLTRVGGAALLHIGATHISTAFAADPVRSKQQLRIAAGQFAIVAALAAREWNDGTGDVREDRIKGSTITSAVASSVLLWRGLSATSDGTLTRYPA